MMPAASPPCPTLHFNRLVDGEAEPRLRDGSGRAQSSSRIRIQKLKMPVDIFSAICLYWLRTSDRRHRASAGREAKRT
jgi:hypothetical protein